MRNLIQLFEEREQELMTDVLNAAKTNGYSAYTSPHVSDWKLSVSELTKALAESIGENKEIVVNLGGDYPRGLSEFAIEEALKHKERGVPLTMFLSLMKHYRNAYINVIEQFLTVQGSEILGGNLKEKIKGIHWIITAFDIIEIKFITTWMRAEDVGSNESLERKVMDLTNEKNRWLAIFESIPIPIIHLNKSLEFENLNIKALEALENIVLGKKSEASFGGNNVFKIIQNMNFSEFLNYDFQTLQENDEKFNDHIVAKFQFVDRFCEYSIEIMKIKDVSSRLDRKSVV